MNFRRYFKKERVHSLRIRLLLPVFGITAALFLLNLLMFFGTNRSIRKLNQVYATSIRLNELEEQLTETQKQFVGYMNTRSDAAEDGFRTGLIKMQDLTHGITPEVVRNPAGLLERNIFYLSESYYEKTLASVRKKRSFELSYQEDFREAGHIYNYLLTSIRSLNGLRFQMNSSKYEQTFQSMMVLENYILTILILLSLFELILLYDLMGFMIQPLRKLSEKAEEIARGNMEVILPEMKSLDEVGILNRAFSQMMDSVRAGIREIRSSAEREMKLKEKELLTETLLKDAQLKYYQAQISPHFLFNTLNAGQQLAMMEGAERTYSFINNTAEFFRGQLHGAGAVSSIRQELQLLEHYMYIMNVRFSGEYQLKKQIDERYLDLSFPGMVMQPIVENSIHYAFPEEKEEKCIFISMHPEGRDFILSISDNGVGIEEEKIREILEAPIEVEAKTIKRESNGVGLRNVRERLRLFYERQDVFHIRRKESGGTEVLIRIPIEKK